MRLDPFIRDYRAFMDELVEALEAESTRFYLDTSLLMWLIRLGGPARAEFIDWCARRPADSVRVPVWAAHELHRHLIRGTVASNVHTTISETEKKLDDFARLASERADEAMCLVRGYAGRDSYIGEIEQSVARVRELCKLVNDDTKISDAADDVIAFVNDHVLNTDLVPIIDRLWHTGEFRYNHLMPPGYHDRKDENRYGDVVIWEEMIRDILAPERADPRHGVLISRDDKTDWVSSAPLIRSGDNAPHRSNRDVDLDVTRAHPLLVHEFVERGRGDRLYVVHPGFLASALDYAARKAQRPSVVSQWMAASHRSDLLGRLAGRHLVVVPPPGSAVEPTTILANAIPPATPASGSPPPASFSPPALTDLMNATGAAEVRAYLAAIPQEQPSIVAGWIEEARPGSQPPWKLGRLFADLALAEAADWLTQLPAVIEQLSAEFDQVKLNEVALGTITPAYFDRYGELMRRPNLSVGAVVLILEHDPRLAPAFAALNGYLTAAGAQLPYLPGSGRERVRYVTEVVEGTGNTPRVLRSIRIGDQSALVDPLPAGSLRSLSHLLGRTPQDGCTPMELLGLIAREYLIPPQLLTPSQLRGRLTWPPAAGLAALDAESDGGLSALADEEEDGN